MSRSILVVGGAGYIGSHVNCLLSRAGYETFVIDNLSQGHLEFVKWGEFRRVDLLDRNALRTTFELRRFDAVVHCAGLTNVGHSSNEPLTYYQNNIGGLMNLLDSMIEHRVPRLIFSSTCAVYGAPQRLPLTEDLPEAPIHPYGWTKLMCERIVRDCAAAHGLDYVFLRYFNAAGADTASGIGEWHEPETHLIPLVLDAALNPGNPVSIFGTDYDTPDGTCIRDYVHVSDVAASHLSALRYLENGRESSAFNIANSRGYSVREVIETATRITGMSIPVQVRERRIGDAPVLIGNASKARTVLGWTPRCDILEAVIESAWIWHQHLHMREDSASFSLPAR